MCKKLICLALLIVVSVLGQGQTQGAYFAAWWDGNYPTNWADDAASIAVRDAFQAAGYEILDSAQLKTFMDARIADGASSVVVFCRDIPPDTVVETNTASCTLRQYLDAGGRVVLYGDIPFWNQGNTGGGTTNWGQSGATGIFGFSAAPNAGGAAWDAGNTVTITDAGIEWGLTETWTSQRPALATDVDIVLAADNAGNAAAWVKFFMPGDTSGGFVRLRDTTGMPNVDDIMRAAAYGLGGNPYARGPNPKDGALLEQTWGSLTWFAGDWAVSHDLYMGTNFDDVNNGTADTFIGNLPTNTQIIGFTGFPFPDGLVPGTTYYWRVDEVNDANAASPWKGDVWNFSIMPKTAFEPIPADGAKFVETDGLTLSWAPGFDSRLHYVYFGASYDEVANATGAPPLSDSTFTPGGPLEPGTTYYWRVDEFDVVATHKGSVWSFMTGKLGGGVLGQYYHWIDPDFVGGGGNPGPEQAFTTLMLTRTDPQINFSFSNSPDPTINDDMFSARWTGEVEAAFTETYTFYTSSDDGVRLWIDGRLLVDAWIDQGTTEYSGTIDLEAGENYSLVMEYYENGGGAVAELRWSSPSQPKEFVPQAALSLPVRANSPFPNNGAVDVTQTPVLQWDPGLEAVSHDIYLGADLDTVANATKASPEYVGSRQLGDESYAPAMLAWNTTYYWRIDEVNGVNPDSPWVGGVWSFTTAGYGIVDDFEFYNDIPEDQPGSNLVYIRYQDGYANPNVNGSTMGYVTGTSMESDEVHSGDLSGPMGYNNTIAAVSEVVLPFTPAQDWTANGVLTLSLWFYGDPANTPGQLYVKVNGVQVNYNGDASNLTRSVWQVWNVDLTAIGTNMSSVTSFAIGIQGPGASGTLLLDDIRLYEKPREFITPVQPDPAGLVAHFALDGNANDSAGTNNGTLQGDPQWVVGYVGGALEFDGSGDWIECGNDPSLEISSAVSVTAWIKIGAAGIDHKVGGNQDNANGGYKMSVVNDKVEFEIRTSSNTAVLNRNVAGGTILEVGVWNHVTGVYSQQDGYIGTYVNGLLDRELLTNEVLGASPGILYIGCEPYNTSAGNFNGVMDEIRIYNRALSAAEAAGAAGLTLPIDKPF